MQATLLLVLLGAAAYAAPPCELVERPDCSSASSGSLHRHETSCSSFYRCDEFGHRVLITCPAGQHFLNLGGELCVSELRVPCRRCLPAQPEGRQEEDCGCEPPTSPDPNSTTTTLGGSTTTTVGGPDTTTERVSTPVPTTERYTTPEKTTERYTTGAPTTERPGRGGTIIRQK